MSEKIIKTSCQKDNRQCYKRNNFIYKYIEGDLHNLRPVVGALNKLRSNKKMGEINVSTNKSGCGYLINESLFQPPENKKGDIARIYLYMNQKYHDLNILTEPEKRMFKSWHLNDPADSYEKLINIKIFETQGDKNPYIN